MPQVRSSRETAAALLFWRHAHSHLCPCVRAAAAGRDAAAENAAQRAPAAPVDPATLLAATLLAEVSSFLSSRGGRASSEDM